MIKQCTINKTVKLTIYYLNLPSELLKRFHKYKTIYNMKQGAFRMLLFIIILLLITTPSILLMSVNTLDFENNFFNVPFETWAALLFYLLYVFTSFKCLISFFFHCVFFLGRFLPLRIYWYLTKNFSNQL